MSPERSAEGGWLDAIRDDLEREHVAWQTALDSARDGASLIELLCDCSRFGNLDWDAGDADHHHWRCTAGMFEYWCARNPVAAARWLESLAADPPAPPVW